MILFMPDTWQLAVGVLGAALLGPAIVSPQMSVWGKVVLYVMVATIGYAVSVVPGRWFAGWLKNAILGDRHP
jgi:hypothetical protein